VETPYPQIEAIDGEQAAPGDAQQVGAVPAALGEDPDPGPGGVAARPAGRGRHRGRVHQVEPEHHLQVRERVQPGRRVRPEAGPVDADHRLLLVPAVVEGLGPAADDNSHGFQRDRLHGVPPCSFGFVRTWWKRPYGATPPRRCSHATELARAPAQHLFGSASVRLGICEAGNRRGRHIGPAPSRPRCDQHLSLGAFMKKKKIVRWVALVVAALAAVTLFVAYVWQPAPVEGYRSAYESAYLDTPEARSHYSRTGSGSPVVLVAGGAQWLYSYRDTIPAPAREHTVYAVELPGPGYTTGKGDLAYGAPAMARALGSFGDAAWLGTVPLVGPSWGGAWSLYYAERNPSRVDRLVLLDSPG